MSMYASANSCVDRLNTEGSKDPASRLTQTADKRKERAMTDEQKQERSRKRRREIGADALLRLPMQLRDENSSA